MNTITTINMGYDNYECIICYCQSGENNFGDHIKEYNVCAECYQSSCHYGLIGNARYVPICPEVECTFCEKLKVCLYQVSLCPGHVNDINKEKKELKENTYEGSVCSGRCSCPHCPVEKYRDIFDKVK